MLCALLVCGPMLGGGLEQEEENCFVLLHRSKQRAGQPNTLHIGLLDTFQGRERGSPHSQWAAYKHHETQGLTTWH